MKTISILMLAALSCVAQTAADWRPLFNGRNLDGWIPKITGYETGVNFGDTFRVENGVLQVSYDQYGGQWGGRFGHIFHQDKFSYYIVRVEYRFTGGQVPGGPTWAMRNSGIMLHCQAPQSMQKDQDFPISIEFQLLGGLGKGPRSTGNLCTPGTNVEIGGKLFTTHCLNSQSPTFDGDQWVTAEAVVLGSEKITHKVNGAVVLEYEKPQVGGGSVSKFDPAAKPDGKLLEAGWISLQSESHPVEFRKVELLNLAGCMDRKSKRYRSWYVKHVPEACR